MMNLMTLSFTSFSSFYFPFSLRLWGLERASWGVFFAWHGVKEWINVNSLFTLEVYICSNEYKSFHYSWLSLTGPSLDYDEVCY